MVQVGFGAKFGALFKLPVIFLYWEVLRGCIEHGECHRDIKRPITRVHLPTGSVVRTDVPWEQLGAIPSQHHLQMKSAFLRKKLVISVPWGFAWTVKKLPCSKLKAYECPQCVSALLEAEGSFVSRWISACTEWPRAVRLGTETISCDYASCKARVGSWLNTWRASQYWYPPCSDHSVIRTYSRWFRDVFMPAAKQQSHVLTALKMNFLSVADYRYINIYIVYMDSN